MSRAAGVTEVPETFGFDDQGCEVVSYLLGDVAHYPLPDWLWHPEVLGEAAKLLRRIHDASVPLASMREGWQLPVHEPVEVICHNDFAPYNLVITDGHVTDAGQGAPDASIRSELLGTLSKAYCGRDDFGFTAANLLTTMAARLNEPAESTEQRAREVGAKEFLAHAEIYRSGSADVLQLAASVGNRTRPPY